MRAMSTNRLRQVPTREAIIRAVASSTAIETGKRVATLERQLREKSEKFRGLVLKR